MNCPGCGAPMQMADGQQCLRCDYCKNVYFSEPDDSGIRYLDEMPGFQCPACGVALWNATLSGAAIRACKRCRGMLVPMGIFEELIDKLRDAQVGTPISAAADQDSLNRHLPCPQCHRHMEAHFYYGGGRVVIEDCEQCSLNWLEGTALMRIVHAVHASDS